jgi:glycosyltransferase involved in cell wall biosynthesis
MSLEYVIITPAHNEAACIEKTMQSVIGQTVYPKRWIIVNDGSTDGTEQIVRRYAADRKWIELLCLPQRRERHFAAKVQAFNMGYERVRNIEYEIIGNLDADISFERDYFAFLLNKFEESPNLGVAGTDYVEGSFHSSKDSFINVQHVNGQCQMFRRKCFEDIGGYVPIKGGGIDWVAVTTARMKGWKTQSFGEKVFVHHRPMGTANGNQLEARFHYGKKDYFLGGHPLWEICRGLFQMTKKPYLIGGSCLLLGYLAAAAINTERPISKELLQFHRSEQIARLKKLLSNRLNFRS